MIVEGSVVREGDRVRVTAQLIQADSDHHSWARSYQKPTKDVLSLQGEVAAAIANEVEVALTPFLKGRLERRSVDPDPKTMIYSRSWGWPTFAMVIVPAPKRS